MPSRPTGHAVREKVFLSIMRGANYLTYIDKAILRLNSHPLVKPGIAMSEIKPLIVFQDELLDAPLEKSPTSYEILEYTLAELQRADTVRMKIRGGWPGEGCDYRFGEETDWATLENRRLQSHV